MHTSHNMKTRQHGAVLVISLLILLVLTLIGVSSLGGSIMEEKMAANSQIATTTFQQAESSIREAFFTEFTNPFGAVSDARSDDPLVNRDRTVTIDGVITTITSTSQHRYDPDTLDIAMTNSSGNIFVARTFEIVGIAQVGAIRSVNIQGYRVLNVMASP
ncbi:MAG: PilX N-terminal domain-containing pilus assembly protein [Gammaproteobacteria bacterium]|nr:PilX N-terminal domain-containing pilus assembly protein [Gammaproteobacteria bacterium]